VLEVLNLYLVHKKILVTKNGVQTEVEIHPNFRLFATMNPAHYLGRQPLSEALLDRFIQKKISISRAQEEKELIQIVRKKTGLDDEWSRRLVQAHFQLVDTSKTWRTKRSQWNRTSLT